MKCISVCVENLRSQECVWYEYCLRMSLISINIHLKAEWGTVICNKAEMLSLEVLFIYTQPLFSGWISSSAIMTAFQPDTIQWFLAHIVLRNGAMPVLAKPLKAKWKPSAEILRKSWGTWSKPSWSLSSLSVNRAVHWSRRESFKIRCIFIAQRWEKRSPGFQAAGYNNQRLCSVLSKQWGQRCNNLVTQYLPPFLWHTSMRSTNCQCLDQECLAS